VRTLADVAIVYTHEGSTFILTIGILCFVSDLAYIALLAWARMHPEALETGVDTRLVHA
jgi:hypothetical protein